MSTDNHLHHLAPEDREDILELRQRIADFRRGLEDPERFKHFRLTRGVYGQRQSGVQMFRTKIPLGRLSTTQLEVLADLADRYATGRLHLTTRQNVQLHFVRLEDAVPVWEALAAHGMTAREACGNTVRNVTASPTAGIDPLEPFDVSPYAHATFRYFLRNPVCQDMGRKVKIAFSSSEADTAFTYFHDFGFIPRLRNIDGQPQRGFKVLLAGGLGAQSMEAHVVYDFLPANQIIPFMEAALRVFDRYGERTRRMKARMKFLVKELGLEKFLSLVAEQQRALKSKRFDIDVEAWPAAEPPPAATPPVATPANPDKFEAWRRTNVFEQKQQGFCGVFLTVLLGDLTSEQARRLAAIARQWAADDLRITINQGILLRFVRPEALPLLHNLLDEINLGQPGFFSTADITACPGTDTCALGVTNSTGLAQQLEQLVRSEFPQLLHERYLKINISGCMNSCGQHMAASIGFHGSSIKRGAFVIPAMQVVLGGGIDPDGTGRLSTKIIKLPTRRIPQALRLLLSDYLDHGAPLHFNAYFRQRGESYFYELLKPLADVDEGDSSLRFDWGQHSEYVQSIGTGECAGAAVDVVGAILADASKKLASASRFLDRQAWADAIYQAYTAFITAAKAALLAIDVRCNTHIGIVEDFQKHFVETGLLAPVADFPAVVFQLNQEEPQADFASRYLSQAQVFLAAVAAWRAAEVAVAGADKTVIENYRA